MTDDLAGQQAGEGASAPEAPATPAVDIEALKAQLKQELSSEFEQRAAGFQRALNEKDAALKAAQQKAREAELSGMTEDERDALEWQQTQDRIAQLERENALLSLASDYPEEMPVFRQILDAADPKAQLELIRSLRAQQAQAQASPQEPAAEPEPEIPPVDPNNPPRVADYGDGSVLYNGKPVTADWADQVLRQFTGPAAR